VNNFSHTEAWHWHKRLISLKAVKTYLATHLTDVAAAINGIFMLGSEIEPNMSPQKQQEHRKRITELLKTVLNECEAISLPQTSILAQRMISEVEKINEENAITKSNELEDRFQDEIESVKFLLVKADRVAFYENTEHAGEQFKERFPRANVELIEAGNCFALDRYTACVFHLMRSLEIALAALHRSLGIPEPEKGSEKTWGKILGRIFKNITDNDSNPPLNWASEKEFHHRCYALFQAVKVPYRDSTMHVESIYDEQSAFDIFNVTVAVLRFVATKLSEK